MFAAIANVFKKSKMNRRGRPKIANDGNTTVSQEIDESNIVSTSVITDNGNRETEDNKQVNNSENIAACLDLHVPQDSSDDVGNPKDKT